MTSFRPYEPDQQLLLPPSLRDWLPSDHLVWFISETVDQLDLGEILEGYRDGGQGNLPYHPAMMLKILVQVVQIAGDAGLVRMGTLAVDGSKIRANAQTAVDGEQRISVAASVQPCASDARALIPIVDQAKKNVGRHAKEVLADAGYASEANLKALEQRKIKGYVSLGREGKATRTPNPKAHATKRMAKLLQSKRGRQKYKQRKHIAEPPFGWVKRGLGFRQFSLRGLRKVSGEFNLVCMAMNLRRMATMIRWT